jgi:PHD/YefM family antitoxin component YafN of YafNO toxin-antitoxin module
MLKVTSSEFAKNFGKYRAIIHSTPVAVTAHQRVAGYFLSAEDYDDYVQLKKRATRALAVEELSEETIRARARTKMHKRHKPLDKLMD